MNQLNCMKSGSLIHIANLMILQLTSFFFVGYGRHDVDDSDDINILDDIGPKCFWYTDVDHSINFLFYFCLVEIVNLTYF